MKKKLIIIGVLIVVFLLCIYLSLFCGYGELGVEFIKSLKVNEDSAIILKFLREPRAIKAVVAGASLSLAGLFMQTITRNPLAEPYITGISSGAGLAIVISILFAQGTNPSLWGFFGAIISSVVVILFAGLNKFSVTKLILTGLCVNIFVSSLISLLILTNGEQAYPLMLLLSGGVGGNSVVSNKILMVLFLSTMAMGAFIIPKLNFLRLDENLVASYKGRRDFYLFFIIILSSFLTSLSVFAAGIIGFVGIIVPQLSKMLVGQDFRLLFVVNILLGSSLLLFSDFISRTILYPLEIPLGLIIALIGAPIFIFFLTKKGGVLYD